MLEYFQLVATTFSKWAWGPWLLVLLLGGGVFFLLYTRFVPFRYLPHAWQLLRGRFDNRTIRDRSAISRPSPRRLAGTIGMGNIAGVALAITIGGPGAIFWMWITAIFGIATKFFTCSLAVMYRGRDDAGELQGGPMYVIREALHSRWRFLAYWFAFFGLIGALPALQANQLVQILRDVVFIDQGLIVVDGDYFQFNLLAGLAITVLTAGVIFGGPATDSTGGKSGRSVDVGPLPWRHGTRAADARHGTSRRDCADRDRRFQRRSRWLAVRCSR